MEARICCLVFVLQIVCWVSATSRHLAPNNGLDNHQPGQSQESSLVNKGSKLIPKEGIKSMEGVVGLNDEAYSRGLSKIGSSPPSCEHKCYGCMPCEAIQVPTTSKHSQLGLQYANYEPEGWKCKCGPSFYSP
ncbi:hypothetical protein CFOL_v3_28364 [Cephalotus follicularis]|uniref:Epidermal patterning factor-like protein n=1 Tax=Cephalotus follicularis TaxID=3775 RepID=A0A1Q3CXL0_CEPFO|nr:hypothetical protein CFOL_v3_28364 [Cephalotus follicularis]